MYKTLKTYFVLSILISIISCEESVMTKNIVLGDADYNIESIEISRVSQKKIYFGHQSVGFNILDGVSDLLARNPSVKLNIVKSKDLGVFEKPVLAHSTIGENSDPELKITDFKNTIIGGIGNKVDIAFFKFCYIDIVKTTDIERVFLAYKDAMDDLKRRFPKTKFIHFTVPLTVTKFSIRSLTKKLIGRPDNNVMRNKFNQKLIAEFGDKEPLFDLAEVESSYPDGSRSTFSEGGKSYFSLAPEYAADSGHLNEIGRIRVARKLLEYLAKI